MRTILWAQNESTDIKPTIMVDGNICEDKEKAQQAFNELCSAHDHLYLSPQKRDKLWEKFKDLGFSHQANFAILKEGKGIYLQGNYENKDVRGRKLPYMFLVSGKTSFDEALALLREQSKKLNRMVNEKEVEILHTIFKHRNTTKIAVLIALIISALCLWKFLKH